MIWKTLETKQKIWFNDDIFFYLLPLKKKKKKKKHFEKIETDNNFTENPRKD